MKQSPRYGSEITLVPLSGIQFLDFAAQFSSRNRAADLGTRWFSEQSVDEQGAIRRRLIHLDLREDVLVEPRSGKEIDHNDAYAIEVGEALKGFEGRWTPVPYFRIMGLDSQRADVHDRGPTNWARVYLTRLDAPDAAGNTHSVVLAFDTDMQEANRVEGANYAMPTRQDAEVEASFSFAPDAADLNWFVDQAWMGDWLAESLAALPAKAAIMSSRYTHEETPREFEHLARYIAFVRALSAAVPLPRIRLIDVFSKQLNYKPIPVDLIVDVGNSRTCGIIIEDHGDGASSLDLSRSDALSLRDLSRPDQIYGDAFQSRVEFSRAYFGEDALSRRSSRRSAFLWPSLVRIGPEAVRLSVAGSGTEGITGMSSPKRYLWDDRPIGQVWRTRRPERRDTEVVSGALIQYISESGELLSRTKRRRAGRDPAATNPAIRPKFSRSSLFMMLMTEILAQTITSMNSPERRGRQSYAEVPRYLRNIILTLPPATPLAERRIMADRVDDAIALVWSALNWNRETPRSQVVTSPAVKIDLDEATATQLVYLYTEVVQKCSGDARGFFQIAGKVRPDHGAEPCLRVASIDIGGGTSDLIAVNYSIQKNTKRTIQPEQLFREGFRVAGDDIVHAVVASHVLHAIEQALVAAGVVSAKTFLRGVVGADRGGMSEQERQFRRRFVLQLLEPAALSLLGQLEGRPQYLENAMLEQRLGSSWTANLAEAQAISSEFEQLAASAGAAGFKLADVMISAPLEEVNGTVRATIGPALQIFAEVVASLDCDVLLLTGRPSRLPVVSDILLATLAVRPDRVVPMHRYRTGKWYPFRDALDRITDPKTTVAVGAMLCFFAEGQIEGFKVDTRSLAVRSTARFIGEMSMGDKIAGDDVLFSDVDLEVDPGEPQLKYLTVETQTTTIGFRQLPLERWPASPLYVVELRATTEARGPIPYPVKVKIMRGGADPAADPAMAAIHSEDFFARGVTDLDDNSIERVRSDCRLQTMKSSSGYWLDTGVISDY